MKRTFKIGISQSGTALVEISDRELGCPEDEEEFYRAMLRYVREEMSDEELIDAMNLDEGELIFVDEYTDKEILIE